MSIQRDAGAVEPGDGARHRILPSPSGSSIVLSEERFDDGEEDADEDEFLPERPWAVFTAGAMVRVCVIVELSPWGS